MDLAVKTLWLIPVLPLLAAGVISVCKQKHRTLAASLAIGSMVVGFFIACGALAATLSHDGGHGEESRKFFNFVWLQMGDAELKLGWVLDPLTAVMLVMVTFVGSLIFIYSVGYMSHDKNFTRFFCFLALFASAMLGVIIANNLLLFFICWELVGLASYLLIGFWYHKPSAAAAAKKAFIVTRIGDMGFFLGMLWLYAQTGTLLFYDDGKGCMETAALTGMVAQTTAGGLVVSTCIGLLIFCGAVGKSGQFPLHVWLPDAMEGPTPVSALIHAATMVAAGVFLVARVYPLMDADPAGLVGISSALTVVTWVGAITAVFAALIAVAQSDIKRILAYSTVSQLGYMMMGIGVGGVAVGMFHLITHAFFKALLFLGAGSVIHGCHDEQDIRHMGGLRGVMPKTFKTYAIGMMALSGVPLLFSGFWSKDEILHSAHAWPLSQIPFYLGLFGALLTAFYMTRQMFYVFFGNMRTNPSHGTPHESPSVMTTPLVILAVCAMLLGLIGTPVWPWFHAFLSGHIADLKAHASIDLGVLMMMAISTVVVAIGIGLGWWFYGRGTIGKAEDPDALEKLQPDIFVLLREKFYMDELYEMSVVRFHAFCGWFFDWLDRFVWNGAVQAVSVVVLGLSWVNRLFDEFVVNLGFDKSCGSVRGGGKYLARLQNGNVQSYLRVLGIALAVLVFFFIWRAR